MRTYGAFGILQHSVFDVIREKRRKEVNQSLSEFLK
jgi:hypothetical protein